jgi:hypothetical protein
MPRIKYRDGNVRVEVHIPAGVEVHYHYQTQQDLDPGQHPHVQAHRRAEARHRRAEVQHWMAEVEHLAQGQYAEAREQRRMASSNRRMAEVQRMMAKQQYRMVESQYRMAQSQHMMAQPHDAIIQTHHASSQPSMAPNYVHAYSSSFHQNTSSNDNPEPRRSSRPHHPHRQSSTVGNSTSHPAAQAHPRTPSGMRLPFPPYPLVVENWGRVALGGLVVGSLSKWSPSISLRFSTLIKKVY